MTTRTAFQNMTLPQLREIEQLLKREIHKKDEKGREKALQAARDAAAALGYDLDEIHVNPSEQAKVYVNPNDKSQTWPGKGRRPKWLIEALKNGSKLEDFLKK